MLQARPLKVLLYTRADAERNSGGDLVEAHRLCKGLLAEGHEAVVGDAGTHHGPDWDVIHLLNIDRAAELAVFLERHDWFPDSRIILAPVFSVRPDTNMEPLARLLRPISNLGFSSTRPSRFFLPGQALKVLRGRIQGLHFHTAAEERGFREEYPGFHGPSGTIPPPLEQQPQIDAHDALPLPVDGPFLAVVGRIEPLKNQIWLANSKIPQLLPVVFVGPVNPKRLLYGRRFSRLVDRTANCHWLGHLEQSEVRHVFERATAHILPSRRENFGLATLEALDAGCEAIVPSHHFIAEELADALHTFDLEQPETLETAVRLIAEGLHKAPVFRRERYTVAAAAKEVLKLYEAVLQRPGG